MIGRPISRIEAKEIALKALLNAEKEREMADDQDMWHHEKVEYQSGLGPFQGVYVPYSGFVLVDTRTGETFRKDNKEWKPYVLPVGEEAPVKDETENKEG